MIPNSVITIEEAAFSYCTNLTSITIPDSVVTIGNRAFRSCTSLVSITIPNSVTTIGTAAFDHCVQLTSFTIPNSLTRIENETFISCTSLASIIIPDNITSIGEAAFSYCTNLTSVIIPHSVINIEDHAFSYCENLASITNLNPEPVSISLEVFRDVPQSSCTLKVPASSVSVYQAAPVWKNFNIIEVGIETFKAATVKIYPNPTKGELTIDNGELTINNAEYLIYSVTGQLIMQGKLPCRDTESHVSMINIASLANGIYYLKIMDAITKVVKF